MSDTDTKSNEKETENNNTETEKQNGDEEPKDQVTFESLVSKIEKLISNNSYFNI